MTDKQPRLMTMNRFSLSQSLCLNLENLVSPSLAKESGFKNAGMGRQNIFTRNTGEDEGADIPEPSKVHCHNMPQGGSGKSGDTYNQNALEENARTTGPYFDKSASKNVTALLGKTTYLNCRVKNLGNKTIVLASLVLLPENITRKFDSSGNSYKNFGSSIFQQTYWLNLPEFELMQSDFFLSVHRSSSRSTFFRRDHPLSHSRYTSHCGPALMHRADPDVTVYTLRGTRSTNPGTPLPHPHGRSIRSSIIGERCQTNSEARGSTARKSVIQIKRSLKRNTLELLCDPPQSYYDVRISSGVPVFCATDSYPLSMQPCSVLRAMLRAHKPQLSLQLALQDLDRNIAEAARKTTSACYVACGQNATTHPDSDYMDRTMAHSFECPSTIRCRYLIDTSSIREHMSGEGVPLVIFHRTVISVDTDRTMTVRGSAASVLPVAEFFSGVAYLIKRFHILVKEFIATFSSKWTAEMYKTWLDKKMAVPEKAITIARKLSGQILFVQSILLTSRQSSPLELLVAAELMILAKSVLGAFLLFSVLHNPRITLENRQKRISLSFKDEISAPRVLPASIISQKADDGGNIEDEFRRDSFSANPSSTKGNSCFAREFALLHEIEEDEREIESESANADVFSNARVAKTNNAKANILANFGGVTQRDAHTPDIVELLADALNYFDAFVDESQSRIYVLHKQNAKAVYTFSVEIHSICSRSGLQRGQPAPLLNACKETHTAKMDDILGTDYFPP
ncbi:hypothetical protein EAG_01777 [Camponotus floridanus]|uniref:Uncharacterized protein n=1 Tax=Camponotus floridanus TaxID=104421 RepID=E2AGJ0_CAMFO|nr:hypothetical protein EAG_01777 [Camponotus floridanus]